MDELMQKITEKLNLSIDKAPEVYNMLKWQYAVYDTCNLLIWITKIVGVIAIIYGLCRMIAVFSEYEVKYSSIGRKSIEIFWLAWPFVVVVVVLVYITIYRNTHAPDILLLKEIAR